MSEIVEKWFAKFELKEPTLFPELILPSDIILRVNSENKVTMCSVLVRCSVFFLSPEVNVQVLMEEVFYSSRRIKYSTD